MALKKKRVKRHKKNPVRSLARKHTGGFTKHRRHRRNPDGMSFSSSSLTGAGLGILGGVVAYKFANGLLQTEGNGKYLTGLGLAVVGYFGLSKLYKPMALPFAIAVGAIVVNEYISESGLLDGLLGDDYTPQDIRVLQDWQRNYNMGAIPANSMGAVPANSLNGIGGNVYDRSNADGGSDSL